MPFLYPLLALLLLLVPGRCAHAHEIPASVVVRTFVKPDGARVRVLVRVPLESMRDVSFPTRGAGLLDVARAEPTLRDAAQLWIADGLRLRVGDRVLAAPQVVAVRAALPGDRAFESYAEALRAVQESPLPVDTDIPVGQVMLDVLLDVPTAGVVVGADADVVLDPQWAHLGVRTTTVVTLILSNGATRVITFDGDPGEVRLDPRWWQAAWRFVRSGMAHMFSGIDHLLFILCLVLPIRTMRPLVGVVTAFTIAHSITLVASAMGFAPTALWFPPLVELLIAASIVYMALENIVGARVQRRWMIAFAFGLIHGFGFATALREQLQFAGAHLLTSLAAFNVGVEIAQLVVLAAAVPVLRWVFARAVPERIGVIIASAFITHEAWHWLLERAATLRTYRFTPPVLDALFLADVLRGAMGVLIVIGVAWGISGVMRRLSGAQLASRAATGLLLMLAAGMFTPRDSAAQAPKSTVQGVYTPAQATKGKSVFNGACLGCHTTASHMGAAFELRWFGRPLSELYGYLSNLMPKSAPGTLTEDEYVWVTAYILKLNGMPAGKVELNAEPAWLKAVRIDGAPGNTPAPLEDRWEVRSAVRKEVLRFRLVPQL
ncbi:HupE/UreJ family protein [Gemmatimonas sp.]|uniref:HupE/UreJ family protein n=1 Tax=Gemmatimonas sp. TaxID=1962908 RepID=UPI0039835038